MQLFGDNCIFSFIYFFILPNKVLPEVSVVNGAQGTQSSGQKTFISEVTGSILVTGLCEMSQSAERRGFSQRALVHTTGSL